MPEITDTGFPIKIDVFSQFADLLGKVGDNLAKLAAGIKEAAGTGRALYRSWRDEFRMEGLVRLRRDLVIHNNKNNLELLKRSQSSWMTRLVPIGNLLSSISIQLFCRS